MGALQPPLHTTLKNGGLKSSLPSVPCIFTPADWDMTPFHCNPPCYTTEPSSQTHFITICAPTYNLHKENEQILSLLANNSDSFVKNSTKFASRVFQLELDEDDLLVSLKLLAYSLKSQLKKHLRWLLTSWIRMRSYMYMTEPLCPLRTLSSWLNTSWSLHTPVEKEVLWANSWCLP